MQIHVVSIFPEMFQAITEQGVVGRALQHEGVSLTLHNPRDFSTDKHRRVDDRPYGGGPGMVMAAEPLVKAIEAAKSAIAESGASAAKVVYLSPQGQSFNHRKACAMAEQPALILLAGRYEGVDERVLTKHVDEEWSIGDYVLSGGELAAMVVIDAIARLLPESLGNCESAEQDSFVNGLLDCPHYTRPENFAGDLVPKVLTNGDHEAIKRWRLKQSLGRTWQRRPDLLKQLELDKQQQQLLEEFIDELDK